MKNNMQTQKTSTAKKTSKTSAQKPATKKTATKKTTAKKTAVKKVAAKKAPAKKAGASKAVKKAGASKAVKQAQTPADPTLEIIKKCRDAIDDKKAEDIKVLDVRGKSPITNYFIIATATSTPHLRALAGELEKTLKELGVKAIGRDYNSDSGWVVVDGFDFMAHIFLPEERGMYGIESLWKDADIVNFQ